MGKIVDGEIMDSIKVLDLAAGMLEEALAVFRIGGWDEDSIKSAKIEMIAFLNGDVEGYNRSRFIVALLNNRVVGVSAWAPSMCAFSVYELSWATVLPEWRHRGICRLMLRERITRIRSHHGPKPFSVLVFTWDNPMYADMGFSPPYPQRRYSGGEKGKLILMAQFEDDNKEP